jgi:BA14K-like protein
MSNHRKFAVALLCSAGIAMTATTAASAMPANLALKNAAPGAAETVRWRGHGWGWGLGGFAAGAIIGGAIAAPYYYGGYSPYGYYGGAYPAYDYPPPPPPAGYYGGGPAYGGPAYRGGPAYGGGPVAGSDAGYCAQRYRSYDPATGTFLGNDGQRHPCP